MRLHRQAQFTILAAVLLAASGTLILQANNLWHQPAAAAPGSSNETAGNEAAAKAAAAAAADANVNDVGEPYPGNPAREAQLVERESERLIYVRTVSSAARWRVDGLEGAYRLRTGSSYTLVLPARAEPYTVGDLSALSPKGFTRQSGGAYVLSENVIVLAGANLSLLAPEGQGLDIRLESDKDNFVSIVALGGSLTLQGSETADVSLSSWDSNKSAVDTYTADGRAYIRVLGGHATFSHTRISHLGFWSGNTGGIALTGSDQVSTFQPATPVPPSATEAAAAGAQLLPAEVLTGWAARTQQDYSVVTAGIDGLTVAGNAFGLFVSNARDIVIQDTAITGSLVDGLVLHRSVTDAEITRTTSSGNAVDGFTVGSATTRVSLKAVTAERNGRNGISMDGRPLADGPNAVGAAVDSYGGNRVARSIIEANRRYGIELSGGSNLDVENNTIADNEVGVVVNHGAREVGISRNTFRNQTLQAVSIRDADASAAVHRNIITGGDTGIYVRNAHADITGNDLKAVSNHGITLLGEVKDTSVENNVLAGDGSSALWVAESTGATVTDNDLLGWAPAYTAERVAGSIFQPLTLIWVVLGTLLLVTALTRTKRGRRIRSPYAEQVPLTSLSRGIATLDDVGRQL